MGWDGMEWGDETNFFRKEAGGVEEDLGDAHTNGTVVRVVAIWELERSRRSSRRSTIVSRNKRVSRTVGKNEEGTTRTHRPKARCRPHKPSP